MFFSDEVIPVIRMLVLNKMLKKYKEK